MVTVWKLETSRGGGAGMGHRMISLVVGRLAASSVANSFVDLYVSSDVLHGRTGHVNSYLCCAKNSVEVFMRKANENKTCNTKDN